MDRFLIGFWGGLGGQVGAKIQETSIPEGYKNQIQVKMNFEGLLDRFWVDLGLKLGGKLELNWKQN